MCAIIDANVASDVFDPNGTEAGRRFFQWISSGVGVMVIGGKLREELFRISSVQTWAQEAIRSGRVRIESGEKVNARTAGIENKGSHSSDDAHVLALAQISGARLLYSNDRNLQRDFRSKTLIDGPRGKVQGPFHAWLRSPDLCGRAQKLGAFCRFGSSLPPRLSELVILTVARHTTCQVEWHLHEPIARGAGVANSVIEAIKTGRTPEFAREDESAVYAAVTDLLRTHRLSNEAYAGALAPLGERGVVDLVGIVGYYVLVALTLNGFEVPVPGGAPPPLSD